MALTDEGTGGMVMPVAPMYGNGGGNGWGDSSWWFVLLILAMFGGWGGGFGGGTDGAFPWIMNGQAGINANTNAGFDNAAVGSQLGNIQNAITSGFGDVQNSMCGGFAGVTAGVNNGFSQAEIANNARQIADMQNSFAMQTSMNQGFNSLQAQLAQCCCDNRLANCQQTNTIVSESAATRSAIQSGVQSVLDKLCADKIDEKNEKIVELQNKLNMADFAASQASQNNYLQNALTAQTQYFLSLYPPTATVAATSSTGS